MALGQQKHLELKSVVAAMTATMLEYGVLAGAAIEPVRAASQSNIFNVLSGAQFNPAMFIGMTALHLTESVLGGAIMGASPDRRSFFIGELGSQLGNAGADHLRAYFQSQEEKSASLGGRLTREGPVKDVPRAGYHEGASKARGQGVKPDAGARASYASERDQTHFHRSVTSGTSHTATSSGGFEALMLEAFHTSDPLVQAAGQAYGNTLRAIGGNLAQVAAYYANDFSQLGVAIARGPRDVLSGINPITLLNAASEVPGELAAGAHAFSRASNTQKAAILGQVGYFTPSRSVISLEADH